MPCWQRWRYWSPTCTCALVFQAGLDVYLLDRCNGARFSGFLLAEDGILDVYEEIDNRYKVIIKIMFRRPSVVRLLSVHNSIDLLL